jgi:hypothetical protein
MFRKTTVGLALLVVAGVVAASAYALTGDRWSGTTKLGADGTLTYQAAGDAGHHGGIQVWSNRSLAFTLSNDRTGAGPYTIQASGRFINSTDPNQGAAGYTFIGDATLLQPNGKVACKGGTVTAGGYKQMQYPEPSAEFRGLVAEVTFPKNCSVLPGTQYVEGQGYAPYDNPALAHIWSER